MKRVILSIIFVVLTVMVYGIKTDIIPPHPEGFFIQINSLGYSFGEAEISTIPLGWPLGLYNATFRLFMGNTNVINLYGIVFDPGLMSTYAGEPRYGWLLPFNIGGYLHTNMNLGRLSLKLHGEVNDTGIYVAPELFSANYFVIHGIWLKGFGSVGFYVRDNVEVFGGAESGILFNIYVQPESTSTDFQTYIDQLRNESLYSMGRVGLRWYYDNYSAVEIGYRYKFKESPLMYLQGFTPTDWIYNLFGFLNWTSEGAATDIKIPFITTDYYLTFSARF
ncbi:hypothetical protein JYK00_00540 [Thermosipho ferrireducens]|uniref:Uncharacterized protein n=1 Tax=Thermosipho ferrireducens TaxID=2571116 RepID=A0ABX7S8V5_9BACT|nr:hypothetical protein [Thermosipho ferrireducens]QTA38072.1 hypothetical protein JYK00_00540 [Thermosipho ferrireducens]